MATRLNIEVTAAAFSLATIFCLSGCEGDTDQNNQTLAPSATTCVGMAQAQVLVQDGYFEDMCGCAESAGGTVSFFQPAPVTCTVPVGTTIYFVYAGSVRSHQIISSGSPTFVSSPLWDPPDGLTTTPIFAFLFSASGTYTFLDAMDPAMTGSIVVQ
jgi:plastocyanin